MLRPNNSLSVITLFKRLYSNPSAPLPVSHKKQRSPLPPTTSNPDILHKHSQKEPQQTITLGAPSPPLTAHPKHDNVAYNDGEHPWVQLKYTTNHPCLYPSMVGSASSGTKAGDLVNIYTKGIIE